MLGYTDLFLFGSTLFVAAIAGTLSGMLGIGGGIFFVPTIHIILNHYFHSDANTMVIANNTSLICILCLNVITMYQRHKDLDLKYWEIIIRILLLGSGAFLGGFVIRLISQQESRSLFGITILLIGLYYFLMPKKLNSESKGFIKDYFPITFFPISFITSLLGIGGAIFLFPLQMKIGYSKEKSAATATLSTIIVASASLIWFFIEPIPDIPSKYFIGDIFWPMLVISTFISPFFIKTGIKLNKQFTKQALQRILAITLIIIAITHLSF
jgi:uncharacterized membrane protein YfcA